MKSECQAVFHKTRQFPYERVQVNKSVVGYSCRLGIFNGFVFEVEFAGRDKWLGFSLKLVNGQVRCYFCCLSEIEIAICNILVIEYSQVFIKTKNTVVYFLSLK